MYALNTLANTKST